MKKIELNVIKTFVEVPWNSLKEGDQIWYTIRQTHPDAQGPFTVVDIPRGRLRNRQGVEMNLPQIQPLKMLED